MLRIADEASVGTIHVNKLAFADDSEFTSALAQDLSALATKVEVNLKANKANPDFTGLVALPAGTTIGSVTSTQIGHLSGVTSAIQTQLDIISRVVNFNATSSTATSSQTSSARNTILFNTCTDNDFNTSTGQFTAPVDGVYLFNTIFKVSDDSRATHLPIPC